MVNAGSSSLKYQLVDVFENKVIAKGLCERVGSKDSYIKHGADKEERIFEQYMENHEEALRIVFEALIHSERTGITSLDQIDAIGHRVVHGGNYFDSSAYIDDDVIAKIEELCALAPLPACTQMHPRLPGHDARKASGCSIRHRVLPNATSGSIYVPAAL